MGGFRHTDWLPKFECKMTTCLCITTSFHSCQRDPITSVTANPSGDRKHSETQNDHSFVATGFISNLFFFFFSQHFFTIPTSTQAIVSYANSHALRRVQQCQVAANRPHASGRKRENCRFLIGANPHTKIKRQYSWQQGTFPKDTFPPPVRATLSPPRHGGQVWTSSVQPPL